MVVALSTWCRQMQKAIRATSIIQTTEEFFWREKTKSSRTKEGSTFKECPPFPWPSRPSRPSRPCGVRPNQLPRGRIRTEEIRKSCDQYLFITRGTGQRYKTRALLWRHRMREKCKLRPQLQQQRSCWYGPSGRMLQDNPTDNTPGRGRGTNEILNKDGNGATFKSCSGQSTLRARTQWLMARVRSMPTVV